MIAGGIGITPMLSMLRTLSAEKDRRKVSLFYAAKNEENLTGFEEIEQLKKNLNLNVFYVVEDPPKDHPSFRTGYVTKECFSSALEGKPPQCFVCGPPGFLTSIRKSLRELNVPYKNVHVELFQLV